ncbi:hypothetical protein [Desulfobulbus alkaliphilus]|uniref:hypothetical protein n=1 Tax=Desulfobulbus alkaliphilus TaxID=869814 RepID=UPI00196432B5|nr:hypothetical protein [Desulfobulbus alkaliphilus]MBM9536423.1 hypothetical protein [Desulfobulbus alkaliphilus]
MPRSVPLDPEEQQDAAALLTAFVQQDRPTALDADLRLQWDILGSKGGVGAIVQWQRPAFLRFSATDPLGRPFLTAVSDGSTFTMVDNRVGRIYKGTTNSEFWHSHVPAAIHPEDVLPLLGGFLIVTDAAKYQAFGAPDLLGFWYVGQDPRSSVAHHVLIDRQTGTMLRHLLVEDERSVLVDVVYSAYGKLGQAGYAWPREVRITGKALTGTLTLWTEMIYSHDQLPWSAFHLSPPPHFVIEQVR